MPAPGPPPSPGREDSGGALSAQDILNQAIEQGDLELARRALDEGAEANFSEDPPLIHAVNAGRHDIADLLLERGADVHFCGKHTGSPLVWATARNDESMVRLLLGAGAFVRLEQPDEGSYSLHAAASHGNVAILSLLLKQGGVSVALESFDEFDRTPLHCAIDAGHLAAVACLLEAGSDPNARVQATHNHRIGDPPLRHAVYEGAAEMVQLLLQHGADPDLPGWMGNSARDDARQASQEIRVLLEGSPPRDE